MKKILFSGAFCAFMLSAVPVVVIPQNANLQEKTAAQELTLHLKLATGKMVKTVAENAAPKTGKRIFVGKTAFAKKNKVNFAKFAEEEHYVKGVSASELIISGGHPRGTLYGVYEFLENNLNAMWLDEVNIKINKVKSVTWKKNLFLHGKPAIAYRSIWNNFIKGSELYKIRNRQNAFHYPLPAKYAAYGIFYIHGSPRFCHTFYDYTKNIPKEDYDILSLSNGKRVYSTSAMGPGQVCYSNPKTAAHFIKKLKQWIPADRKGKEKWQYPFLYGLKTNDNRNECECSGCAELVKKHGWSGAKIYLTNKVAQAFAKEYPDILFCTDAYGLHGLPPENLKPASNVTVDIAYGMGYLERPRDHFRPYSHPVNAISKRLHEKWAALTRVPTVWDYWVDCIRWQYPSNPIPAIAENIKFYKKINVMYLMAQDSGAHVKSLWRMSNIIGYRLMVDPNRDLKAELNRFANAFYGKGAPYMLKFYALLDKATMSLEHNIQSYTLARRHDLTPAFFKEAEALLKAADKATKNNKIHNERVHDERVAVEWAKIEKFKISDKTYIENFRKNVMRRMKYQSAYHAKSCIADVNKLCRAALANVPAPKGFEKATIISDYAWPQLSLARYNKIVDDPDAAGGKTAVPGAKHTNEDVGCGIYDTATRKYPLRGASLPLEAVPKDGKYHWYYLGRCRLTSEPLLYLHRGWLLQLPLSDSFGGPEICDNDVAVYISLKVTDKMYAVDRVVTVRGDISAPCHLPAPLPADVDRKKLVAELSRIALIAQKQADKNSAVGSSAPCGVLNKKGLFAAGVRDLTKKIKTKAVFHKIPRDGKYRVYTVYSGIITRGSLLVLGDVKLDISGYNAMLFPEQKYEIKASLAASSDGKVSVDRVFISK